LPVERVEHDRKLRRRGRVLSRHNRLHDDGLRLHRVDGLHSLVLRLVLVGWMELRRLRGRRVLRRCVRRRQRLPRVGRVQRVLPRLLQAMHVLAERDVDELLAGLSLLTQPRKNETTSPATRASRSSPSSGKIGSASASRVARSASGIDPGSYPRNWVHSWRWSASG